jgi:hypothetical protein
MSASRYRYNSLIGATATREGLPSLRTEWFGLHCRLHHIGYDSCRRFKCSRLLIGQQGRPAQKRNRAIESSANRKQQGVIDGTSVQQPVDFEDDISHDVEHFLFSKPEADVEEALGTREPPTRSELIEASFSLFHFLPILLSRDAAFASSIGSQPLVRQSVLDLIDDETTALLDNQ